MHVEVKQLVGIETAREAIESTMRAGFEAKCSMEQLCRWEHSPLRAVLYQINLYDIPTYVSVHLVRHSASGKCHFVKSNREDRGGAGDEVVNRLSPVSHMLILNAQHLIDISKKRLCYQASKGTREVWNMVWVEINRIAPALAKYMVPNCVYRGGYCPEPKPCGNYKVKVYDPDKIWGVIRK